MARNIRTPRRTLLFFSILFLCIGILIGIGIQTSLFESSGLLIRDQQQPTPDHLTLLRNTNETEIVKALMLPAVDREGNGALSNLTVRVRKGTGLVLVNINNVLADYSTQYSAREAALAATAYTNINTSQYDLIYQIQTAPSNAEIVLVGGPSAGAAMAVTTVAALQNRNLLSTTIITGTIDADGNIGQVGGLFAKAQTAKAAGITTFLVPPGQSTEIFYREESVCTETQSGEFCDIAAVPYRVDIAERLKINVREVATLAEAIAFFEPNL